MKRNNLITITSVLALNVSLVRFSGVKTTFVSDGLGKTRSVHPAWVGNSGFVLAVDIKNKLSQCDDLRLKFYRK